MSADKYMYIVTKKKEHLRDAFVANGYPVYMVKKFLCKSKGSDRMEQDKNDTTCICLPYVKALGKNVDSAIKDIHMHESNLCNKSHPEGPPHKGSDHC